MLRYYIFWFTYVGAVTKKNSYKVSTLTLTILKENFIQFNHPTFLRKMSSNNWKSWFEKNNLWN
jgi:hypothetical protein